jgi:TonB family protein
MNELMRQRLGFAFRLLVSGTVATVAILSITAVLVTHWHRKQDADVPDLKFATVQLISKSQINNPPEPGAKKHSRLQDVAPVRFAPRKVSGFVQLEFTVQPDGRPTNVHIVGAEPKGYYEKQAKQIVESRLYTPAAGSDGAPAARHGSEVIPFSVPAKGSGG